ncbi:hypothetical protein CDAR_3731, partial [Caerostris darwini]
VRRQYATAKKNFSAENILILKSRFPSPRIPEGMVERLSLLPNAASELRVPSGCECEIASLSGQHSFLLLKKIPSTSDSRRDGRASSSLLHTRLRTVKVPSGCECEIARFDGQSSLCPWLKASNYDSRFPSPTDRASFLIVEYFLRPEAPQWLVHGYAYQWAAFVSPHLSLDNRDCLFPFSILRLSFPGFSGKLVRGKKIISSHWRYTEIIKKEKRNVFCGRNVFVMF